MRANGSVFCAKGGGGEGHIIVAADLEALDAVLGEVQARNVLVRCQGFYLHVKETVNQHGLSMRHLLFDGSPSAG